MASKVYFSKTITPEKVLALYEKLGRELPGPVAVKLHSGESGNQNFLGPDLWRAVIDKVGGTVVECNTAYAGSRNTTEAHWKTMAGTSTSPWICWTARAPTWSCPSVRASAFTRIMWGKI